MKTIGASLLMQQQEMIDDFDSVDEYDEEEVSVEELQEAIKERKKHQLH
jgi:hypothetical protein